MFDFKRSPITRRASISQQIRSLEFEMRRADPYTQQMLADRVDVLKRQLGR